MKDLNTLLFRVSNRQITPHAGLVLASDPFVTDECFSHGVVSVIDYVTDEGATGVVLNNHIEYSLGELVDGVSADRRIPVFCGGPVEQDRLFFIHTLGPDIISGARMYADGIYVGGSFDDAIGYINRGYPEEGYIRFFVGHANWADGQLERELRDNLWAAVDCELSPEDLLTGFGDHYWHRFVKLLGEPYRSWSLLPRNAACN